MLYFAQIKQIFSFSRSLSGRSNFKNLGTVSYIHSFKFLHILKISAYHPIKTQQEFSERTSCDYKRTGGKKIYAKEDTRL
jgi:hypothetical protein